MPSSARVAPRAAIVSPSDDGPAGVVAARGHEVQAADPAARVVASPRRTRTSARIPGLVGFDHCLKQASVLRRGAFAFHVVFLDTAEWRLGLVVPKRFEKSAVARNTIKRRWREAFRLERQRWADEFGGGDLVIRMHSPLFRQPPKAHVAKTTTDAPTAPRLTARQRGAFDAATMLGALAERVRHVRSRAQ